MKSTPLSEKEEDEVMMWKELEEGVNQAHLKFIHADEFDFYVQNNDDLNSFN